MAITYAALLLEPSYKDGVLRSLVLKQVATAAAGAETAILFPGARSEYLQVARLLQGKLVRIKRIMVCPTIGAPINIVGRIYHSNVSNSSWTDSEAVSSLEYVNVGISDMIRQINWLGFPAVGSGFLLWTTSALLINDNMWTAVDLEVVE